MNMYLLDYAYFLNYFASAKELQAWHVFDWFRLSPSCVDFCIDSHILKIFCIQVIVCSDIVSYYLMLIRLGLKFADPLAGFIFVQREKFMQKRPVM